MPQTWFVDTPPHGHVLDANSVGMLLDASHQAAPAAKLLAFINQLAPVEYMSLAECSGESTMRWAPPPRW